MQKPELNKVYRLTYVGCVHKRGWDIISEDFTYMARRGNRYYFFGVNRGIDLTISKTQFNEYLANTIEKLKSL